MEELDLEPALAIRRALRASPRFCIFALLILSTLSIGDHSEYEMIVGVLAGVAALCTLLLASGRALIPRVLKLVAAFEVLTVSLLLSFMVALGGFALSESFQTAPNATLPLLQSLLTFAGVGGVYVFMYPRRTNLTNELTARQLLYGGVRSGPDREIQTPWMWLMAMFACDAMRGIALFALAPTMENGLRLLAGFIALVVFSHAIAPALRWIARSDSYRALRYLQESKTLRRNGSYTWYVVRNGQGWKWTRSHILWAAAFSGIAAVLIFAFSTPGLWASLLFIFLAYSNCREVISTLAQRVPERNIQRIEDTREFTLYLRSFRDDDFRFDLALTGWRRLLVLPPSGRMYLDTFRSSRLEELVVKTLWRYRPVLAIAGPETPVNPIGALQIPISDEAWKEEVVRKANACHTIVSIVGSTPGAIWETRMLLEKPDLRRRTFFLIPQEDPAEVITRWQACFGYEATQPDIINRAIIVRPTPSGHILITATHRTRVAYTTALHVAETLVARDLASRSG